LRTAGCAESRGIAPRHSPGWAVNIEFMDDPHARNTYWEMWGLPMFAIIDFPDYADDELLAIGELILAKQNYKLSERGREALARYIVARKPQRTI
jgi:hypothetical protein